SISAKEFSSIEMFNTLGQSVLILEGGKDIQVNTSEFNKGIYLVRFSNKDTAVTKRLVIE
ncbi:MAG: T9SS type A sorting domain-containing protein, partial [Bacteroidota bacterium]